MATATALTEKTVLASLRDVLKIGKMQGEATHQAMLADVAKFAETLKGRLADPASTKPTPQAQPAPVQPTPSELPTKMTLGGVTFDLLSFMEQGDGTYVNGNVMRERGVKLKASMTEEDGKYILAHRDEIPVELRGKVYFAFPDWRNPDGGAAYLLWSGGQWVQYWRWLDYAYWYANDRLVRRVSSSV